MSALSQTQIAKREKTLIIALLLSMMAPLATGIAVILSNSTTQLADFIRRTVELIALFISWRVFRYVEKGREVTVEEKNRLEMIAGLSVAAALGVSGIVMLTITVTRFDTFDPGGNVYPGLIIAVLGLITNSWFFLRYKKMTAEHYNPVIDSQRLMYRAKTCVDFCVIIALSFVAVAPAAVFTQYLDSLGSIAVAVYLLWSAITTLKTALKNARTPEASTDDRESLE
ncbi:MAG: cation transporter [Bacillota bacterium]